MKAALQPAPMPSKSKPKPNPKQVNGFRRDGAPRVGSVMVHPHHGIVKVTGVKRRENLNGEGKKALHVDFAQLPPENEEGFNMDGPLTISMPLARLEDAGIRLPMDAEEIEDLLEVFDRPPQSVSAVFGRRFKSYQDAMGSGDLFLIAKSLHTITSRQQYDQRVSPAESKLAQAMIEKLAAEIAASKNITNDEAVAMLQKRIDASHHAQPIS